MTVLFFAIIACMRVIQSNCSKRASALIEDRFAFFHYGGYYQLVSAALGFISLCFAGFSGWNAMTLVCAVAMAALFSLDLFSSLQAVKGGTLILLTMFSTGGLFVPCIVGIFLFDEPMSVFQWLGLAVFFVSVYLLISGSRQAYRGFSVKTFVMLILNLLANGAVMVVQKIFALKVPNGNVSLFSFLSFGLNAIILFAVFCILSIKDKRKPQLLPKKTVFVRFSFGRCDFYDQSARNGACENGRVGDPVYDFKRAEHYHHKRCRRGLFQGKADASQHMRYRARHRRRTYHKLF